MKKAFTLLLVFLLTKSFSQNLQNSNWCFLENVRLNFNIQPVAVSTCAATYHQGDIYGGSSASVSDQNGQLLFYTDGVSVWKGNNTIIANGTNIGGGVDPIWNQQTTIIVPKPGSDLIYYIFTSNRYYNTTPSGHGGIHYTAVDMTPGNEHVINSLKNIPLNNENAIPIDFNYSTNTGLKILGSKITSTLNADKDKVWVTVFTRFDDNNTIKRYAYSYLISGCGVNQTPVKSLLLNNADYPLYPGEIAPDPIDAIGSIKISPDAKHLADAAGYSLNLYDFDNQTGEIQFNKNIYLPNMFEDVPGRGVEFSPNSLLLYFSIQHNSIFQSDDIRNDQTNRIMIMQYSMSFGSTTKIGEFNYSSSSLTTNSLFPIPANDPEGDLQLAIDDKIYVCDEDVNYPNHIQLGIIQNPDISGLGCNFIANGVQLLPGTSHEGNLPQWVHKTTGNVSLDECAWPKVYHAKHPDYYLHKDENGNILFHLNTNPSIPAYNHIGALPPTSSIPYSYTYQYTSAGITNYTETYTGTPIALFPLHSGNVQAFDWHGNQTTYFNGATGQPVTGPSLVPQNEIILAETSSGTYITKSSDWTTLFVHSGSGTTSITFPFFDGKFVFNAFSNKLYFLPNSIYSPFKQYSLINNALVEQVSNSTIPGNFSFIQVDEQDNVYALVNGVINKYDYVINTFSPISINGFNNNNFMPISSSNPYVSNQALLSNTSENKIYDIDFNSLTTKSISISNSNDFRLYYYVLDGDKIYIAGINFLAANIGGQSIPFFTFNQNTFITKFSLQNDFSFKSINSANTNFAKIKLSISLSPNPAYDLLKINVREENKANFLPYKITVTNDMGFLIIKKDNYISGSALNVQSLPIGTYYVEITNNKKEKTGKTFLKL